MRGGKGEWGGREREGREGGGIQEEEGRIKVKSNNNNNNNNNNKYTNCSLL